MKGVAQMRFMLFLHLYQPHFSAHDEGNYVIITYQAAQEFRNDDMTFCHTYLTK
jgi:hypothetical protein